MVHHQLLTAQVDFNIIWEVTLEQEANMPEATITLENIYEALKTVYDPEIPVNIVDLGLVYDVQLKDTGDVYVQMTLTFPGCGMGPYIGQQAEWAVQELDGVEEVEIEMVFDPPWSPELISEEARSQLGI
jgi:metal-sulfur cluster biosynthetic enzyme